MPVISGVELKTFQNNGEPTKPINQASLFMGVCVCACCVYPSFTSISTFTHHTTTTRQQEERFVREHAPLPGGPFTTSYTAKGLHDANCSTTGGRESVVHAEATWMDISVVLALIHAGHSINQPKEGPFSCWPTFWPLARSRPSPAPRSEHANMQHTQTQTQPPLPPPRVRAPRVLSGKYIVFFHQRQTSTDHHDSILFLVISSPKGFFCLLVPTAPPANAMRCHAKRSLSMVFRPILFTETTLEPPPTPFQQQTAASSNKNNTAHVVVVHMIADIVGDQPYLRPEEEGDQGPT